MAGAVHVLYAVEKASGELKKHTIVCQQGRGLSRPYIFSGKKHDCFGHGTPCPYVGAISLLLIFHLS